MEEQGLRLRPLKDKLRDHWKTKDEILAPKPEKANKMGIAVSLILSTLLTLTASFIIVPSLGANYSWQQIPVWMLYLLNIYHWRLARTSAQATRENVPQTARTSSAGLTLLPEGWKHCAICQLDVPPRSHHCKICGVCILKRDHHCFFTGTCIGYQNQRRFMVFLFYSCLGNIYGMYLIIEYLTNTGEEWSYQWYNYMPGISLITWLFGTMSFGNFFMLVEMYASCMIFFASLGFYVWEYCMIFRGQTSFEAARNIQKYRLSPLEGFRDTFGYYGLIHYLLPLSIPQTGNGVDWQVSGDYKGY